MARTATTTTATVTMMKEATSISKSTSVSADRHDQLRALTAQLREIEERAFSHDAPSPHLLSASSPSFTSSSPSTPTASASSTVSNSRTCLPHRCIPTGWPEVDQVLQPHAHSATQHSTKTGSDGVDDAGTHATAKVPSTSGLAIGAIHEFLGLADPVSHCNDVAISTTATSQSPPPHHPPTHARTSGSQSRWTPPMFVLNHLAIQTFLHCSEVRLSQPPAIVWIGVRVQPYFPAFIRQLSSSIIMAYSHSSAQSQDSSQSRAVQTEVARSIASNSFFVDPPNDAVRLWAIDTALRTPNMIIIADGSRLSMAGSRRLQLAAESGGSIGLFARPPSEQGVISAARTRWMARRDAPLATTTPHTASWNAHPRWQLELFRFKGAHSSFYARPHVWTLEMHRHAPAFAHPVVVPADLCCGSGSTQTSTPAAAS